MTLQAWLEANPFTLALSSGFFGFFAHAGFVKALEERGLAPRKVAGASSGSIVGGAVAAGLTAREIENLVLGVRLEDFWDPAPGLGFVRGKKIERLLTENFGADFSKLKIPLDVATFNIFKRKTEIFSSGNLARVIRASSAIPLMFHPVMIDGQLYWDGGIFDKMGLGNTRSDETIFGHSLDASMAYERFERRKLITLKNLPRSGPRKLHLGPEILATAYKQTLEILASPIQFGIHSQSEY